MNTNQSKPADEGQLEYIKKEIKKTYLYLISRTAYDPGVVEILKLSALTDVQRRYEESDSYRGY